MKTKAEIAEEIEQLTDPRRDVVQRGLQELLNAQAHLIASAETQSLLLADLAAKIVDDLDRTPVPFAKADRPTLAAARELLHVHRFDYKHDKVGGPDSIYRGLTYGTVLLRDKGAIGLAQLHDERDKAFALLEETQPTDPDDPYIFGPEWYARAAALLASSEQRNATS